MFAGHLGAALVLGRFERRVNVGILVAAALLLDFALWLLVLLDWESVTIPDDFSSTHQPEFVFPYSHGLFASVVWSALAAGAGWAAHARLGSSRARAAALVGAAVFSHWLLDALVHRPELPLAGEDSLKIGVGLWANMPVALFAEAAIVTAGLVLFLPDGSLSRGKAVSLAALCLVVLVFTVVGMTIAPPPPSAQVMAATSLFTLIVVCALAYWFGRPGGRWPA